MLKTLTTTLWVLIVIAFTFNASAQDVKTQVKNWKQSHTEVKLVPVSYYSTSSPGEIAEIELLKDKVLYLDATGILWDDILAYERGEIRSEVLLKKNQLIASRRNDIEKSMVELWVKRMETQIKIVKRAYFDAFTKDEKAYLESVKVFVHEGNVPTWEEIQLYEATH